MRISRVSGVPVTLAVDYPTLLVAHEDRPGVLATLCAAQRLRRLHKL